ncbi:hypothetical protein [Desulfoferrobacter suflitae]|uniref:hypothetical protein n=1 Tax=Desulfoferrobacter suflitae TaxID=2865782 RepID=UPI002164EFD2|nr:hypothetical protein [Desulfoferrobacter suflitae]MCK8601193.1 hypothetical protein [Desulfoferrobacter suflitae]
MSRRISSSFGLVIAFTLVMLIWCSVLSASGRDEVITGTVIQTEEGIIIEADDGDYLVEGRDLSDMIGKFVEATGRVTETEEGYVISVEQFEELQE